MCRISRAGGILGHAVCRSRFSRRGGFSLPCGAYAMQVHATDRNQSMTVWLESGHTRPAWHCLMSLQSFDYVSSVGHCQAECADELSRSRRRILNN